MTSTDTYTAENVSKPTSRVLAPPGGTSNIDFGGYGNSEGNEQRSQKVQSQEPKNQTQEDLYNATPPQPIKPAESSFASLFGDIDPKQLNNNQPYGKRRYPHHTDMGNNPVTGSPTSTGDVAEGGSQGRSKPIKLDPANMPAAGGRVENKQAMKRQPPGGKDSGIFSGGF